MSRFALACLAGLAFTMASAQVITDLGQKNMKIPRKEKDEEPSTTATTDFQINVDSTSTYYIMVDSAQACIGRNEWGKAEDFIRKALATEPNNASNTLLISNLATLQRYQGKQEEALKNYNLALDITPNAVTLLLNRAALLLEMGRTQDAVEDFEHVRRIDANDVESRYSLGVIAIEQGDYKTAQELFNEVERINPKSVLLSEGRGLLAKAQGDYKKAVEHLGDVIRKSPDARNLANRADCLLMLGKLYDASDDIQRALELKPDDPYLYVLRAKLNKLRYNTDDMTRDINLAVEHGLERGLVEKLLQ